MPVSTPTAFAAVPDFLRGGLAGSALKTAPTDLGPVTVVGAGTGAVTPGGTLDVGALRTATATIDVQVIVEGMPGTATFRWRLNGGAWSAAAATPAPAPGGAPVPAPLGATGLSASFAGALTAADVWSFPAVSCVQQALNAWNARMDAVYLKRLGATPATWDAMAVQRVVDAARRQVLTERGYNPENPSDKAIADAGDAAVAWFDAADMGTVALPGDPTVPGSFGGTSSGPPCPTFGYGRRGFVGF